MGTAPHLIPSDDENEEQQHGKLDYTFKFAILVAGFVSRSRSHKAMCEEMLEQGSLVSIPTLHVIGETDRVIESNMSDDLLKYFSHPEVYNHSGGHFVPTAGPAKTTFVDFLAKCNINN